MASLNECSICNEPFKLTPICRQALCLPCGHTVCRWCLTRIHSPSCPSCRAPFNCNISTMAPNYALHETLAAAAVGDSSATELATMGARLSLVSAQVADLKRESNKHVTEAVAAAAATQTEFTKQMNEMKAMIQGISTDIRLQQQQQHVMTTCQDYATPHVSCSKVMRPDVQQSWCNESASPYHAQLLAFKPAGWVGQHAPQQLHTQQQQNSLQPHRLQRQMFLQQTFQQQRQAHLQMQPWPQMQSGWPMQQLHEQHQQQPPSPPAPPQQKKQHKKQIFVAAAEAGTAACVDEPTTYDTTAPLSAATTAAKAAGTEPAIATRSQATVAARVVSAVAAPIVDTPAGFSAVPMGATVAETAAVTPRATESATEEATIAATSAATAAETAAATATAVTAAIASRAALLAERAAAWRAADGEAFSAAATQAASAAARVAATASVITSVAIASAVSTGKCKPRVGSLVFSSGAQAATMAINILSSRASNTGV